MNIGRRIRDPEQPIIHSDEPLNIAEAPEDSNAHTHHIGVWTGEDAPGVFETYSWRKPVISPTICLHNLLLAPPSTAITLEHRIPADPATIHVVF
ncbi:hypothetical protein KEJ44_00390 [Candidatus Bathyarchaeota archaeon]|nr:hypothetical protein [Candidatus Bathyarchaeota archaeon]